MTIGSFILLVPSFTIGLVYLVDCEEKMQNWNLAPLAINIPIAGTL